MRLTLTRPACITVLALLLVSSCRPKSQAEALSPQIIARSRLSDGDLTRLQHVMAKARRGEPVTIGVIGGSIAHGQAATSPDRQFADRVAHWWIDQFPRSQITLVNAGVPGTGSNYGCIRANRDLLFVHPDFIIVEFGVNDRDDADHGETYEGLIHQLLSDANQPAILLLFLMHTDGTNAQATEGEVGRHYGLPMISYRDALWPEIAAGRMKVGDIFFDRPHPNDRGHAAIAAFINAFLQDTFDHLPVDSGIPAGTSVLPTPRFTDLYAHTAIIKASDLKPTINDGWSFDAAKQCWRSRDPGSSIEFEIPGQVIDLLFTKMDGGFGKVRVTVDDGEPLVYDSWLNGSWGPLCQMEQIVNYPGTTSHRVRLELLSSKNLLSTGHEFEIVGFGSVGATR